MANGIVTGIVKSVRASSFMLDDGNWYGAHPESGLSIPNVGNFVALTYYTKSVKHDGGWRTFRNLTGIRITDKKVNFRATNEPLNAALDNIKFVVQVDEAREDAEFDDDIPF